MVQHTGSRVQRVVMDDPLACDESYKRNLSASSAERRKRKRDSGIWLAVATGFGRARRRYFFQPKALMAALLPVSTGRLRAAVQTVWASTPLSRRCKWIICDHLRCHCRQLGYVRSEPS